MALTINETPVHWDNVAPPGRLPPWMEVVWIGVPRYPRRLWFLSKTGSQLATAAARGNRAQGAGDPARGA